MASSMREVGPGEFLAELGRRTSTVLREGKAPYREAGPFERRFAYRVLPSNDRSPTHWDYVPAGGGEPFGRITRDGPGTPFRYHLEG